MRLVADTTGQSVGRESLLKNEATGVSEASLTVQKAHQSGRVL
jgi:hypothetical protein